jgi:putative ABC transport system permease protein
MSRSSVPCRCAAYSRSLRFRIDIRPEYAHALVECQPERRLYGLAFAVSHRTRELAIRVAIGAERGNQIRLVMAHSLRLVVIGATLGTALTFGLSRVVRAAGGAGSLDDPPWPAFVIPVVIVMIVAALATWIPARRALRVNPSLLLKST